MIESLEQRLCVLPEEIRKDMQINELNLLDAILKQPALYAYYAHIYCEKMKASSNAKVSLCALEGQINEMYMAEAESGKKLTDKDKEKRLKNEPKWKMAKMTLDRAEAEEEYYRNLLEALRQKRDMLYQMALRQRDELKSNISVSSPSVISADLEFENKGKAILERMKNGVDKQF